MKKSILLSLLLFGFLFTNAQSRLRNGEMQLNAGVGLSSWGYPVYAGLEFGVHEDVSIGFDVAFRTYREKLNNARYNHGVFNAAFIANYHFNTLLRIPDPWDFYAGLSAGYFFWQSPDGYPRERTAGIIFGAQVGGRYYFSDRFGINLQFGGGNVVAGGRLGLSVKF